MQRERYRFWIEIPRSAIVVSRLWLAILVVFAVISHGFAQSEQVRPVPGFGGPQSVISQIARDAEHSAGSRQETKQQLVDQAGLSIGADLNVLGQTTQKDLNPNHGWGGVARFYGHWALVGHDTPDVGQLVFKVESRSRLGTPLAPQGLGHALGYAGLTSVPFSDAGALLTNLFWQQSLQSNRVAFVAGIVDVTDYVDVFSLGNPWTDFNNLSFSTNPTIPAPNQGLGAAVRWRLGKNFYALAGVADANAQPSDPLQSIEDFFQSGETFKHIEFGWFQDWESRFDNNVHVTFWHADRRRSAMVSQGWGASLSWSMKFDERWSPFVRAGFANGGGAIVNRAVSVGTGYALFNNRDMLGAGIGWSSAPRNAGPTNNNNQLSAEVFYRYQPVSNIQITPSLQLIGNPAFNRATNAIWAGSVRARITF